MYEISKDMNTLKIETKIKEQGITPLSSAGQLVLMTEKNTGSPNLPSKLAWPCLSRKFIWKERNLGPAGIVYIGKK